MSATLTKLFLVTLTMIALLHCGQPMNPSIKSEIKITTGKGLGIKKVNPSFSPMTKNIVKIRMGKSLLGNGIILPGENTWILTSAHVYHMYTTFCDQSNFCPNLVGSTINGTLLKIREPMQTPHSFIDLEMDIALIMLSSSQQLDSIPFEKIKTSTGNPAEIITVIGFHPKQKRFVESSGHLFQWENDINFLHSADTLSQMSGSPIFNQRGELIGIHDGAKKRLQLNRGVSIQKIFDTFSKRGNNGN